jgi:long-chain fatty acid transport protein
MPTYRVLGAAALFFFAAARVRANATRLPDQDPQAISSGYAFVATASDPSAVYYNPSGLAGQPTSEISGSYVISSSFNYQGTGGEVGEKGGVFVLPHFFATVPLDGFSLGFGFYAPYGLQTSWPDNSGFRNLATTNKITFLTGAVSVAKALTPQIAVGASIQVDHFKPQLAQGIGFTPGDLLSYNGSDTEEGWNAGLMWTPSPEHQFGLTYESRVNFHLSGQLTETPYGVNETGDGSWAFPDHLAFGYSYRPTSDWNFEADADWTHWDILKTVSIHTPTGPITLPFFWKNSWYCEFGASRYWKISTGRFRLSAGYFWSENSIPDEYYSPSLPDMNRNLVTLGCGYDWAHWKLSFALVRALRASRRVTDAYPTPTGETADGTYATSFNALDIAEEYAW